MAIVLGFGFSIIALTYFISMFFDDPNSAIRWNLVINLLVGTVLPLILGLAASIITSSRGPL